VVVAAGFEPALAAFSTPCLCQVGLRDRWNEMAPAVGLAPTRTGLKDRALGSLHSRACLKWRNAEGMLPIPQVRDDFFSKESRLACPVHVPMVPTAGVALALSEA
jgi:hypothetical protein